MDGKYKSAIWILGKKLRRQKTYPGSGETIRMENFGTKVNGL